jgi:tRNA threonylcarbamoyladenosine biosynthesis protein TsaE
MDFQFELDQIDQFAGSFWKAVNGNRVFAFHGEMGAGKTTVIKALCQVKGIEDTVASPTFSIINEYSYVEGGQRKTMYHMDLYRLKDEEEASQAGVEDCIFSNAVCMVEWPEKAPYLFDEETVHVIVEPLSETRRRVTVNLPQRS